MDGAATIIPLAIARISFFWFILLAADSYSYDLGWAWDEPHAKSALIVPIEQVPLGSRISTKNPEAFGAENPIPDAHESTWRLLSAEIEREDGAQVEVELLRPVTWIEEQGFTPGVRIYLRLEELNVAGWATIRAVAPCPTLSNGHGNLVTGRFVTRGATNLVEATFSDGLNEPTILNGTSIHPVWSLDRLDWVPLGELAIGEQVYSNDGPLSLVARTSRNQPTDVYNIEVDCEHVYQVGNAGILVHNQCAEVIEALQSGVISKTSKYRAGVSKSPDHHVFPQELREKFAQRGFHDIDNYLIRLDEGTHQALHFKQAGDVLKGGFWNNEFMRRMSDMEAKIGQLSRRDILRIGAQMRRDYLPGFKLLRELV